MLLRRVFSKDKVLRRVLRREGFIEGAWKALKRQNHGTTPFACTLNSIAARGAEQEGAKPGPGVQRFLGPLRSSEFDPSFQ